MLCTLLNPLTNLFMMEKKLIFFSILHCVPSDPMNYKANTFKLLELCIQNRLIFMNLQVTCVEFMSILAKI